MSHSAPGIGTRLAGRYELREALGEGTFGKAWRALDEQTGRTVVVKLLPAIFAKRAALVQRFREVMAARQARDDDGLAKVLDIGVDGAPFVVIEHLDGLSLRQLIDARQAESMQLGFDEVEPILEEIGQILARLHRKGVHGGLKPENVFILHDRVVLTDDGLTEILPPEVFARVQIKLPHAAAFLAPELLSGAAADSREIDMFGIAAIAWALFGGQDPSLPPPALAPQRPELPAGLDAVLARGLAEDPGARYPTISTFLLELARLGSDEAKIRALEGVVAAEASAAAEAALAAARASEEQVRATVEPEPEAATEPEPPAIVDDEQADALFEDVPIAAIKLEPTPSPLLQSPSDSEPPPSGDLLQPAPAIGVKQGGGKGWVIGIAVAVLLLGVVGGLGALGVIPLPGLTEPKAPEVDPRLRGAVERVLDSTQVLTVKIVAVGGEAARSREDFRVATNRIDAARTALAAGDPGGALQSAQEAETGLGEVLKAVEAEAEKKAADIAAAEAAARSQLEEAEKAKAVAEAKVKGCPDGMAEIPAGTFRFGSPADDLLRDISEQPQESRKVGVFCIDRWEYPGTKGVVPKVKVSRTEAQSLCTKAGKRLCSELEWERACKGPDSFVYPYGKAWDADRCNTEDAAGNDRKVAKTGSFPKCRGPFGVDDMSGNVMEWTSSAMAQNTSLAIAKGGSFSRPDYAVRCAFRYTTPPDTRDSEIGFRCCAELR